MRDMSADGYALTKHLETTLSAKRRDAERVAHETGVARGDPCTPGTRGGLPCNPARLGKDLSTLRRVNGLSCAFHDLRHTLATMMMAGGRDVRTAASCLGHVSASMAPDIHADVDPKAKQAAVDRVAGSFDVGLGSLCDFPSPPLRRRALVPAASPSRWSSSGPCSPPQRGRGLPVGVLRLAWSYVRRLFRAMSRWM